MTVIAHAGHWALSALQIAPVFAVAAFAAWQARRNRHGRLGAGVGRGGTP